MVRVVCIIAGISYGLAAGASGAAAEPVDYLREVKPILAARCFGCHGAVRQKAGLRLDTAAFIRRGGDSGPALETGQSSRSLLVGRVTGAAGKSRMPPKSEGAPLTDQQIATLKAWIDQGAGAPPEAVPPDPREHWAFRVPVRAALPPAPGAQGGHNPIDVFLAAARETQGVRPAPPVGKDLWLRRVYLDLIGLPPTREQLHAFRADSSPDAYKKVVDHLLASPRYGERWGRHWMDVWRYSDWFGLGQEVRFSHKHLWRWRDWIIEALNSDKGYDRMIQEMLAGDELAPTDPQTLRATGFLARNWYIFNRNFWLDDVIQHTGRGFLGLTFQCARCHDHKYDPISQQDYYQLRAFFEPHLVRIDRVPGEPDRQKAGLARVYDAWLVTPTYLFVRGDENHPDKSRALQPGVPEVLGGRVQISTVSLPETAFCPDKQDFVIRETLAAGEQAITQARAVLEKARQDLVQTNLALTAALDADRQAQAKVHDKPQDAKSAAAAAVLLAKARQAARTAPEELRQAEAGLALAEARQAALQAVLLAERLEDAGGRDKHPETWTKAAQEAVAAQRRLAVQEAESNRLTADRSLARAQASLDGLTVTSESHKDDKTVQAALQRAATELVEARTKLGAAHRQLAQAESALRQPVTTAYVPRPLAFPRAPTAYREQPPNTPYPNVSSGRRLSLARWITDRKNPLTARVAVNHVWARHFGEPLAASLFDFGLRAKRPLHHDLLDWLAVEFMESGWSMKHLHRLMVTSQAYRLDSAGERADDPNLRADPDNRYYWHMNVRRMEGEVLRDSLLHLAGRLDPALGGPDLPVAAAEAGRRRTIYYRYARDDRITFLTLFDAPSVEECYRRHETIVPQQALVLSNSKMVLTRAGEVAAVISQEVGPEDGPRTRAAFIVSAFERILGRAPTEDEKAECAAALGELPRAGLVHVLMNHNDFITIR